MARNTRSWLSAVVGTLSVGTIFCGVAMASGMDSDPVWRCAAACNNNLRPCASGLKACCCCGQPGGPYGACNCYGNCAIQDPPCEEGTIVED